jgi:drug/metabolite transporter (DMT)-like permease
MRTKAGPILALAAFAIILGYNWVVMKVGTGWLSDVAAVCAAVSWAAAAAWWQLGERPTGLEWGGMACILGALALMSSPLPALSGHERLFGLLNRRGAVAQPK